MQNCMQNISALKLPMSGLLNTFKIVVGNFNLAKGRNSTSFTYKTFVDRAITP